MALPNPQQVQSILLKGVAVVGTIVGIVGIVPADQWANFSNAFSDWVKATAALAGPAAVLGATIWGVVKSTKAAQRTAVAAQSEVVAVVAKPEVANAQEHNADIKIVAPAQAEAIVASINRSTV